MEKTGPGRQIGPERKELKKVLIVDDIEDNRTLLKRLLASASLQVEAVGSGEEALQVFQREPPDLALMDVQMPGMDGYETTKTLRNLGFRTPILALTAHAGQEEAESCLRAGYDLVLTKPVNRQSLYTVLDEYLETSLR